jgi:two-component system alkaline phosphatase synthesis response regulator PhoP/two-component system response regulator VicR
MGGEAVPKKVLVVDDDPSMRRIVERVLQLDELEVATAANGAECLIAVGGQLPDLIILDVNMPVMDGLQALRALRENAATRNVPVIMLTARDSDDDVARGWMTGVDLYLTKPFELRQLRLAVRRALEVTATDAAEHASADDPPQP